MCPWGSFAAVAFSLVFLLRATGYPEKLGPDPIFLSGPYYQVLLLLLLLVQVSCGGKEGLGPLLPLVLSSLTHCKRGFFPPVFFSSSCLRLGAAG